MTTLRGADGANKIIDKAGKRVSLSRHRETSRNAVSSPSLLADLVESADALLSLGPVKRPALPWKWAVAGDLALR